MNSEKQMKGQGIVTAKSRPSKGMKHAQMLRNFLPKCFKAEETEEAEDGDSGGDFNDKRVAANNIDDMFYVLYANEQYADEQLQEKHNNTSESEESYEIKSLQLERARKNKKNLLKGKLLSQIF